MTERRQPKWQRARVRTDASPREVAGREVWLAAEAPRLRFGIDAPWPVSSYPTNIQARTPGARGVLIPANDVELLARSPADFADEVRLVTYEAWLAGDDGTIETPGDAATEER